MAARSIWKGSISFGLVNIPIKLYSATQERAFSFNQLDIAFNISDGARSRTGKFLMKKSKKDMKSQRIIMSS